jgi:hypothetical protein
MSRLGRRSQRHLRWPTIAGASSLALLFEAGRMAFGPNGGYGSVIVALSLAGLGWLSRDWGPLETKSASTSPRERAACPSFVFLSMSVLLIGLMWAVSASVRSATADQAADVRIDVSTNGSIDVVNLSRFLIAATAAGLVAMTSIQGVRTILPVRGAFHRAAMERWLSESLWAASRSRSLKSVGVTANATSQSQDGQRPTQDSESDSIPTLLGDVASLATAYTGSSRYAFFDLPIEQLCGQIAAGADRLLDDPSEQLASLARVAPASDGASDPATGSASPTSKTISEKPRPSPSALLTALAADDRDVDTFVNLATSVAGQTAPTTGPNQGDDMALAMTRELMRARAGLSQRIQRNIDRLQIDSAFWWKRLLRGLAFALCGAIGLEALGGNMVAAILCAFVGGFIATVARDVVAIVERLRR